MVVLKYVVVIDGLVEMANMLETKISKFQKIEMIRSKIIVHFGRFGLIKLPYKHLFRSNELIAHVILPLSKSVTNSIQVINPIINKPCSAYRIHTHSILYITFTRIKPKQLANIEKNR